MGDNSLGKESGIRANAQDIAVEAIFEMIQRRDILPGSRLFETEIEDTLSISRTPIRQAFEQLAADRILEKRPNQKGFFFPKLSIDDLCHAFMFREKTEILSAELAAVNLTPQHEERLRQALEHEEKLCELRMLETYRDINNSFHVILASVSGNDYVRQAVKTIYMKFAFYEFYYGSYRLQKDQVKAKEIESMLIRDHDTILDVLKRNDPGQAALAMRRHLRNAPLFLSIIQYEEMWKRYESVMGD